MCKLTRWAVLLVCVIGVSGADIGLARACIIDGIPSVSANGRLASDNHVNPAANEVQLWAPFLFSQHFHAGQSIRFAEDVAKLKKVLTPQAFHHPWRWMFGDGTTEVASVASHRYMHPGSYRIVVAAYYPQYHGWMTFDDVLVTVSR